LTTLRELNLSGCLGLQNVRPALSQLTALQSLDLSDCRNLQGVSLVAVARLPALTSLNLSGCTSLVDYSVKQLALLPELRSLNLSRCHGLTDRCFKELQHLKKLQSLFAAECQVGDKGLVPVAQNCPLEVLDLSFTGITDMLCTELGRKTMLLRSLTICGCSAITDAGLISIAHGCGELKSLNARECVCVGNPSLIELAKLKTLENLSVSDCCLISDNGVKALAKAPSLVSLELDGLALVSDDALLDLLQVSSLRRLTASRCGRQRAGALKEQQMRLNPSLQLQL
jgi:F-box/leucine-rich repeat protein 14